MNFVQKWGKWDDYACWTHSSQIIVTWQMFYAWSLQIILFIIGHHVCYI